MNIIDKIENRHKNIKDNKPDWIVVHHSAAPATQTFASIKNYHVNVQHFDTIGYHYLITNDGTIYQGRPDLMHGAHCKQQGMNTKSIGICCVGDFNKNLPTPLQIISLKSLMKQKMIQYNIPLEKIVPHRHFLIPGTSSYKSCYGTRLADDYAQDLISDDVPVIPPVLPVESKFKEFSTELRELIDKLINKWTGRL